MDLVFIRPQRRLQKRRRQRRLQRLQRLRRLRRLQQLQRQPLRLQQVLALPQVLQVRPVPVLQLPVPVPLPQQRQRFSAILIMTGMVELFCYILKPIMKASLLRIPDF